MAEQHSPQDSRRQREPKGRSPAQSAGKAEQSECRAREDYGGGGGTTPPPPPRGSTSRTSPPLPTPTDPPTSTRGSASPKAKPGAKRRQGRAKRMPRQGGLRVGVGGRCNQTVPGNPPITRPPNTRGSTSHTSPPPPKPPRQHEPAPAPKPSATGATPTPHVLSRG